MPSPSHPNANPSSPLPPLHSVQFSPDCSHMVALGTAPLPPTPLLLPPHPLHSVQFSPDCSHIVALGTAGHKVLLYDLRHTSQPLTTIAGTGEGRRGGGTCIVQDAVW